MDLPTKALIEGALGDADLVLDQERSEFWEFQNQVNNSGAVAPSYVDACQTLNLDPEDPHVFGDSDTVPKSKGSLLPHQIQAIAWLRNYCDSDLRGGICADEMDLGKTFYALTYLLPPPHAAWLSSSFVRGSAS